MPGIPLGRLVVSTDAAAERDISVGLRDTPRMEDPEVIVLKVRTFISV